MELRYQQIRIRSAVLEDAPVLTDWWNNRSVMAHAGFPNGLGTTVQKVAETLTPGCLLLLFVERPIGEMCYRSSGNGCAEIGIKICEQHYQNRGIGRIALSMLIHELFRLGYHRIVLDTDLNNTRAQHVYESLGFQKLRVNHNSWQNQLGQWQSSVDYELTVTCFRNYLARDLQSKTVEAEA